MQDSSGNGPFIDRPPKPTFTLTVDNKTAASNPGRVRVDYLRWSWAFPEAALTAIAFLPLVLLAVLASPVYWLVAAPALLVTIVQLIRLREHFLAGNSNPGVVVQANPPLVAVCTDLRTTDAMNHLVIKIVRQPLHRVKGGMPPIGTRIATVALYSGEPSRAHRIGGHWDDFNPIAVPCVSDDTAVARYLTDSISINDWIELNLGLEQLPKPFRPGLYRIVPPAAMPFDLSPADQQSHSQQPT